MALIFYRECLPDGFIVGHLKPHHAEFIFKFWFQEYSHEKVVDFFIHNISRYKNIAVFDVQEPDHPLAWAMFKAGGMAGIRYSLPPYRRRSFSVLKKK